MNDKAMWENQRDINKIHEEMIDLLQGQIKDLLEMNKLLVAEIVLLKKQLS